MMLSVPMDLTLSYLCFFFLVVALFGGMFRFIELTSASGKIRQYVRSLRSVDYRRFQDSEHVMPVSLIVPAMNPAEDLIGCVENLLLLEFRQYEVIVVSDSSQHKSWDALAAAYRLLPFRQPYKKSLPSKEVDVYRSSKDVRLVVLDLKGGSRASALNAGVNVSSYPIVAVTNPALRLTKDALLKAVYAFVGDPACVFIGTFPRVGAPEHTAEAYKPKPLAEMQNIERLRTLYSRRVGYAGIGMYLPRQATFGAFLKSAVTEAGGFSEQADAENADMLLRIHARFRSLKRVYTARLLPDAVCYQQPKANMKEVLAETAVAQRAMAQTLRRQTRAARSLPGIRYTRLAETGWPALEMAGILAVAVSAVLGVAPLWFLLLYLGVSALLGAAQSAAAVLLEENAMQQNTDSGRLLRRYLLAAIEGVGFRQRVALARIFAGKERG